MISAVSRTSWLCRLPQAAPTYIPRRDIPAAVLEKESESAATRAREEGKPEAVIAALVSGRIEKF